MAFISKLQRAAGIAAIVGALGAGISGSPAQAANQPADSTPGSAAKPNSDSTKAIVGVRTLVPPEARSARTLGTEREGSGVLIRDDNLIVTIGYLLM
ncbi:MAG: hypothetical protein AAB223_06320, partial [Pseudomonadota bacterium]